MEPGAAEEGKERTNTKVWSKKSVAQIYFIVRIKALFGWRVMQMPGYLCNVGNKHNEPILRL